MNAINEYEKQATDFLQETGTTFEAKFLYHGPHFEGDKDSRDVYEITLHRPAKSPKPFTFKFGQSIKNSGTAKSYWVNECPTYTPCQGAFYTPCKRHGRKRKPPTAYDVLACLTKSEPGTFEDFCADYGYDSDSRKAEKTYFAVQAEWEGVRRLFGDVLDKLGEIS